MITKKQFIANLKRDYLLYAMLALPMAYFLVFKYIPMAGIVLAFRSHTPGGSIFGNRWVGLMYFEMFLTDSKFWEVLGNTLALSFWGMVFGYPVPIIFALLLNEIRSALPKRFVQTVSYLPKFFSTVVVYSFLLIMLSPSGGLVNRAIGFFGIEPILFLNSEFWFRPIYIISDIWQFTGWNAILYIAALAGVEPQFYEAATIDGANRFQQTLHVTLPGIMPTIIITLILSVGHMLNYGYEKVLLMYTPNIYGVADIIQTYTFRMGIYNANFSYSTAVGLFQAGVSLVILWAVNVLARKVSDYSLW